MTAPLGDRDDPAAKIWPFKVHRGKQPYDTENNYFLVPNVHGDKGFWTAFNWEDALRTGAQVTGLPYSGSFAFAPTEMYFPLSHMVTNPDEALQCRDCHGERGRIDWQALGYSGDPLGRERVAHDPVYLTDSNGEPVIDSGEPLSITETCGMCHELEDDDFIAAHGYHSSVQDELLPAERRQLMDNGPRIPTDGDSEMNCFLCHLQAPDHAGAAGRHRHRFTRNGRSAPPCSAPACSARPMTVTSGTVSGSPKTARPRSTCGRCPRHTAAPVTAWCMTVPIRCVSRSAAAMQWTTETTGQVFSPQPVRQSGMNHANKDSLEMVWDVHAERLVSCGDCHYSSDRPERLAGTATPANVIPSEGILRRCESCHDPGRHP